MWNIYYHIIIYTSLIVSLSACSPSSNYCDNPQTSFSSVNEAESIILNSNFEFQESIRPSESSWVTKAVYKSRDKNSGYLIYSTDKGNTYLHTNVPIELWYGLKKSSSKGRYINANLKGKYSF